MSRIASKTELIRGIIDDVDIFKIEPPSLSLRFQLTNIDELARSIEEKGLLHPLVVRPTNAGSFEIVTGNRRFSACKSLGWRKILCHIVELDDKDAFEISLIENVQRNTLNPVEEARAFKKYVSHFGWGGVSDLASKIGKNASYVTRRIKLLDLPQDVIEAIEESVLCTSIGQELSTISEKSEQSKLGELISRRHLSLRKVRSLIKTKNTDQDKNFQLPMVSEAEALHVFDKTIITLRYSMVKLAQIIENIEDNWILHEILMAHKNTLHSQIDLLIRQKKKIITYNL
jgi:ParB family chromosome partitioning protein